MSNVQDLISQGRAVLDELQAEVDNAIPDDADELRNMRLLMREEKRKLDEWNRISRETMLWQESLQSTSTMKAA